MSPERIAELDSVHDLQAAFRTLVDAFSFPGRLVDLSVPAGRLAPWVSGENTGLALGCVVLIDADARWSALDEGPLARFVAEWGGVRPGPVDQADFVVVPRFRDDRLAEVLGQVRVGTLVDPHLGATVLVGVEDLDQGRAWTLRGPGIASSLKQTLPEGNLWPAARSERVAEFPLGLDLVFFDRRGRALALPRTTRMED